MKSDLDLKKIKKVHMIGIKGSGMASIAQIFSERGVVVSGSDIAEKFFTEKILQKHKILFKENFSPENIPMDVDLVVYSTAYNEKNNPEMRFALEKKITLASYPEVLGELFNQKFGIAVCGTHGKTTTSAILASALKETGRDPEAVVGSKVISWGGGALSGKGEFFVAEADEFQNKLKFYNPKAAILTSCDFDHPDFFPDFKTYKKVFSDFVSKIPKIGFLVVWGDSADTLEISRNCRGEVLTYGFSRECSYVCKERQEKNFAKENFSPERNFRLRGENFEVFFKGSSLGKFKIGFPGKHNILNATATLAVCHKLGLSLEKVALAIEKFQGTARRFEYMGKWNGAILIDDYAHHPEEIKATLVATRRLYPEKNIRIVFHPHTFSRTKGLLSEFSQSFDIADEAIVLDIYGSARESQGGVHSKDLVELINKYSPGKADYVPTIEEATDFLKNDLGSNDVVILAGAGNVWEIGERLLK